MIQLPGHSANDDCVVGEVALPVVDGVDLAATVGRISDWGGSPGLYSLFLGAALVEASSRDSATVRALGAVAGWRAGVIDLRDDALAHAATGEPSAVAAALGLPVGVLAGFLREQAGNRFAWPGGAELIAAIGGFRGFGGSWTAPPTRFFSTADGVFAVVTATELWAVHADVFGSRVSRIDALPAELPDARLTLRLTPDSYLARILRVPGE